MSKPKHTPGPWWVEGYYSVTARNPNVPLGEIGDPDPNYVAICVTTNYTRSHDTGVGNANLIAAAPEMLEMLEHCRKLLGGKVTGWHTDVLQVEAIIAKAKGEDK